MTTQLRPCTAPTPCPAPEWADWFRFRVAPAGPIGHGGGAQ